ncbi:MAG: hypothetical protein EBR93_00245 [Bacteroidetes bacterium]|nr:hypothetical protein [Bacteroidota bacterium]
MFFHVMIRQTMIKKFSVLLLLTFFFGLMNSPDVSAQDREYQLATRLMQQKKYEQACPLFEVRYLRPCKKPIQPDFCFLKNG